MQTMNGVGSSEERSLEQGLEPSLSCSSSVLHKAKLRADEDTEISIFDAQRYFNETNSDIRVCKRVSPLNMPNLELDPISSAPQRDVSSTSCADGYGYGDGMTYRVRSFHATPTASSEASWNSQTGLLSNPPGAIAVSMTMKNPTTDHKRKGCGKLKWLWGRSCPCSGNKSVQVEPKTPLGMNQKSSSVADGDNKREERLLASNPRRMSAENQFDSSLGRQRVVASVSASARPRPLMISDGYSGTAVAGFTFPILNQQPTSSRLKMAVPLNRNHNSLNDGGEDPPRDSLEVFRPSDQSSSISVPKKLVSITDDDVGSDTSSDLFEIESFSTTTQGQTTSNPLYHRRDSMDEASSVNIRRSMVLAAAASPMMSECYEPSEASIEWSVTTAEGCGEAEENITAVGKGGKKKSGNGGLLSCRCEKAVSVGPNPVKYVPPQRQAATTINHVGCAM
ncbi:hypothetical protein Gohar_020012 [Gossypium harknessii]|uniref:Protein PHYTOCHROME KINASE SUBSTRATE 4-like n=1 Tax=Gossypium harknessii TaxID=34285 RepID=A0A7J9HWE2_9ROSI|nr:hypothetical protein [Gossypium harknessii]